MYIYVHADTRWDRVDTYEHMPAAGTTTETENKVLKAFFPSLSVVYGSR